METYLSANLLIFLHNNPKTPNWLDGGYEILPPDSPKIKEIEEYNKKLCPALYAKLDESRRLT
ncbi:MAG: hypothetical protein K2I44_04080, partial [Muribaculaceae bacterium]|nr:hypothetical protein [Muribaculaceae bacterium]